MSLCQSEQVMFRPIQSGDEAVFLEMSRAFFASEAVVAPVPDSHHVATFQALMQGSPFASAWLFLEQDCVVGYALTARTWSREAGGEVVWLEELYLKPQARSKGYATQFFAYLLDFLGVTELESGGIDGVEHPARGGVRRLRLEVCPSHERARRLYARWGFKPLGYEAWVYEVQTGTGSSVSELRG